jgi:uncharacterized protein
MTDAIEGTVAHRPFPMPAGPWVMFQSWRELLFAHWPLPRALLQPLVPPELKLDEFDGSCWLSQTPFRVAGLRPRFLPPAPGLSEFPEMNLRTYVRVGDKPGIFFFSLDAGSRLAVTAARVSYRLPYFPAEMSIARRDGWVHYRSRRKGPVSAEFIGRYRPVAPVAEAVKGTLEYFLAERYALYTVLRNGTVLRGEIHHGPWPLQQAEAEIEVNSVPAAHSISISDPPALLQYSERQDTLVWPPTIASRPAEAG